MEDLLAQAEELAAMLRERDETVAISESSSGGLIAASLLAQAGASAYFLGGAVVYTRAAGAGLLGFTPSDMTGIRSSTEPYVVLLARTVRDRMGATWGIAESGVAGPAGNRFGDAPGHTCVAVVGERELSRTIETGSDDRPANMRAFAAATMDLLHEALSSNS